MFVWQRFSLYFRCEPQREGIETYLHLCWAWDGCWWKCFTLGWDPRLRGGHGKGEIGRRGNACVVCSLGGHHLVRGACIHELPPLTVKRCNKFLTLPGLMGCTSVQGSLVGTKHTAWEKPSCSRGEKLIATAVACLKDGPRVWGKAQEAIREWPHRRKGWQFRSHCSNLLKGDRDMNLCHVCGTERRELTASWETVLIELGQ